MVVQRQSAISSRMSRRTVRTYYNQYMVQQRSVSRFGRRQRLWWVLWIVPLFVITVYVALAIVVPWARSGHAPKWTGFGSKSLWDWLQLLVVPVILSVGAVVLNRAATERDRISTEAHEQAAALDAYLSLLAQLLLQARANKAIQTPEFQAIVRVQTAAIILRLKSLWHKELVFQFIIDSHMTSVAGIVSLNLQGVNLSRADLSGLDLALIDLTGAILNRAVMQRTRLRSALLLGTELRDADLRGADLSGAKLAGADLSGADLSKANLNGADLTTAIVTEAQLANAGSTIGMKRPSSPPPP